VTILIFRVDFGTDIVKGRLHECHLNLKANLYAFYELNGVKLTFFSSFHS